VGLEEGINVFAPQMMSEEPAFGEWEVALGTGRAPTPGHADEGVWEQWAEGYAPQAQSLVFS